MATKPDSNAQITKAAAVREALSALGNEAKPPEIHAHVKKQHDLEIDLNAISSYKSTALKAGKSAIIKKPEPKKAGAKVAAKAKPGRKKVSKMGLVREALEKLGPDAKPLDIQAHIKTNHKRNLPTNTISNYKNSILKGPASKSAVMKKPGRPAGKKPGRPAGRPAGASKNGGGISIQDIEAVKSLTDKIGASKVKELAEVLA